MGKKERNGLPRLCSVSKSYACVTFLVPAPGLEIDVIHFSDTS